MMMIIMNHENADDNDDGDDRDVDDDDDDGNKSVSLPESVNKRIFFGLYILNN